MLPAGEGGRPQCPPACVLLVVAGAFVKCTPLAGVERTVCGRERSWSLLSPPLFLVGMLSTRARLYVERTGHRLYFYAGILLSWTGFTFCSRARKPNCAVSAPNCDCGVGSVSLQGKGAGGRAAGTSPLAGGVRWTPPGAAHVRRPGGWPGAARVRACAVRGGSSLLSLPVRANL